MIVAIPPRRFRPLAVALAGLAAFAGLCIAARAVIGAPLILYNGSPSEPVGFYRLSSGAPVKGALVAFPVPPAGRDYAKSALPYLTHTPILKNVAAAYPEIACAIDGTLRLGGRTAGLIAAADSHGQALPRWRGCVRIGRRELFALSNRIPNSFDSRYYGPVAVSSILGVYKPLWIFG
jgi:type IV secretory pathway protease TraF